MLTDMGDKISESEKTDIQTSLDALKKQIADKNIDGIKSAQEELQKKVYAVSEKVYNAAQQAQQAAQGGAQPNTGAAQPDGNVYDGDFNDVGENK